MIVGTRVANGVSKRPTVSRCWTVQRGGVGATHDQQQKRRFFPILLS
jgi:hypothetical protein